MATAIGIDVGATKVLGCAVDDGGALVGEVRAASPTTKADLVGALTWCIEALIESAGLERGSLAGVGIGLPGLVDAAGVLHETANLRGAEGLDVPGALTASLERLLGRTGPGARRRLVVDNDGACAAAGEHAFGAGRGTAHSVTVTLGTGIGGGIVTGGRILRGERNFSAEVGHMVVDPAGPLCGCGRRGCWEQFASGSGLARLGRLAAEAGHAPLLAELAGGDPSAVRAEHVAAGAETGDSGALGVVDEFAGYLALGLANLAEILDPSLIILGGGLAEAGDALLAPALALYGSSSRRGSGPRGVPVVVAELGERAGVVGAAAMALGVVG